ncbi:chaperone modulator CbpM [Paraburkholderia strydomiana]|jgi:chaperone modulatory protein CbpM|uniref:chaperone modulator CbpM n=1 Tax=Paraburkholderia TaxID=1822464 RepID=UPI0038BDC7E5
MSEPSTTWIEGHIVEEDSEFTLTGLCRATGASEEQVVLWVSEGALGPHEGAPSAWRFKGLSLCHTRIALRLVNEFEINAPGIALALDLLEEIDSLRARIGRL